MPHVASIGSKPPMRDKIYTTHMYRFPFTGHYAVRFLGLYRLNRLRHFNVWWAFRFFLQLHDNAIGFYLASPHVRTP